MSGTAPLQGHIQDKGHCESGRATLRRGGPLQRSWGWEWGSPCCCPCCRLGELWMWEPPSTWPPSDGFSPSIPTPSQRASSLADPWRPPNPPLRSRNGYSRTVYLWQDPQVETPTVPPTPPLADQSCIHPIQPHSFCPKHMGEILRIKSMTLFHLFLPFGPFSESCCPANSSPLFILTALFVFSLPERLN